MVNFKSITYSLANYSCFLDVYGFIRNKVKGTSAAILIYHRIGPKEDSWSLEPLNTKAFEKQLSCLAKNFEIVTLEKLADIIDQKSPPESRLAAVTFDDGYQDNFIHAYPVLEKYGVPATIFLTSGLIGSDSLFWWDHISYIIQHTSLKTIRLSGLGSYALHTSAQRRQAADAVIKKLKEYPEVRKKILINHLIKLAGVEIPGGTGKKLVLTWQQVREMACNKIKFGAHGVTHAILTKMPLSNAKREIINSKKEIERNIGETVLTFSYPNGSYNQNIIDILKTGGFKCGVTVQNALVNPGSNPYELPRIRQTENLSKFKAMSSGLYPDICAMRGAMTRT